MRFLATSLLLILGLLATLYLLLVLSEVSPWIPLALLAIAVLLAAVYALTRFVVWAAHR